MKKKFNNQLEAIDWIVDNAKDEGHFEVLREQLLFNYIYHGEFFVEMDKGIKEVALLKLSSFKGFIV